jgi:hypothetical protein
MMFDSRFDSLEQVDIHVGYDSVGRTGRTDSTHSPSRSEREPGKLEEAEFKKWRRDRSFLRRNGSFGNLETLVVMHKRVGIQFGWNPTLFPRHIKTRNVAVIRRIYQRWLVNLSDSKDC